MPRVPVVGSKQLHTAQLSPEERRIRHRRAKRAGQREYAPVLAADRAAIAGVNQDYQREAGSIKGASQMTEDMLANALRGLQGSGLSGQYLRQAVGELSSRQGDAAAAVPFLLSDAREARTDALGDARQQLIQDRAEMQQSIASDFNQSLEEGRNDASQVLKEQEDEREAGGATGGNFDPDALSNAKLALKSALGKWAENPTIEVNGEEMPLRQYNPLRSRENWLQFGVELDKEFTGFSLRDINKVISDLLRDRERKLHEGRLPQPGVPGAGRG